MSTVININIDGRGVSQPIAPSDPDPYRSYPLLPGFSPVRDRDGFRKIKTKKKKKCSNGQVCGFSCISKSKTCTANMTTAQFKEHNEAKRAARREKAAMGGGATPATQKVGVSVTPEKLDELHATSSWWAGTKKKIEAKLKSGEYAIDENGKLIDTKPVVKKRPSDLTRTWKIDDFTEFEQSILQELIDNKGKGIRFVSVRDGDGRQVYDNIVGKMASDGIVYRVKSEWGNFSTAHISPGGISLMKTGEGISNVTKANQLDAKVDQIRKNREPIKERFKKQRESRLPKYQEEIKAEAKKIIIGKDYGGMVLSKKESGGFAIKEKSTGRDVAIMSMIYVKNVQQAKQIMTVIKKSGALGKDKKEESAANAYRKGELYGWGEFKD